MQYFFSNRNYFFQIPAATAEQLALRYFFDGSNPIYSLFFVNELKRQFLIVKARSDSSKLILKFILFKLKFPAVVYLGTRYKIVCKSPQIQSLCVLEKKLKKKIIIYNTSIYFLIISYALLDFAYYEYT